MTNAIEACCAGLIQIIFDVYLEELGVSWTDEILPDVNREAAAVTDTIAGGARKNQSGNSTN